MRRLGENCRRQILTVIFRSRNMTSVEGLQTETLITRLAFSGASDAHMPPVANLRICALSFLEIQRSAPLSCCHCCPPNWVEPLLFLPPLPVPFLDAFRNPLLVFLSGCGAGTASCCGAGKAFCLGCTRGERRPADHVPQLLHFTLAIATSWTQCWVWCSLSLEVEFRSAAIPVNVVRHFLHASLRSSNS